RNGEGKNDKLDEFDEIVIRQKKSGGDTKVTVEIKDGEVMVNGQPIEKFENEDVAVLKKKARVMTLTGPNANFRRTSPFRSEGGPQQFQFDIDINENKAMLGVSTETRDGSVIINEISENSAAAKAGLQKGDVITKVDDIKIESSQGLVDAIGKYKPEEKVTVTYKRNGKENKATATLGKREMNVFAPGADVRVFPNMENFDFNFDMDHLRGMEDMQRFQGAIAGRPRLGIRAQETEDGKGLKVLDVADESIASKAGIKEDDIILEFNGKAVNSTEELLNASKETKDKNAFNVKVNRGGKTETLEVKIPKKLKTANL
ncbi:MAG: PDZ domain-containing protein, partial [Flavitalea sp.]